MAYSNGAVVAGPASNEQQPATAMHLLEVVFDASEHNMVRLKVHSTTHGVHHGLRLFKDLLLHE